MWATVSTFFASIWGKVLAVGAIVAAAFGLYESVKGSGETEQQNADLTKGLQDVQTSQQVAATVATTSDANVDKQLRSSYSRD